MAKLNGLFCKIKHHAIKISGEVKVKIRALLASEIDGAGCSIPAMNESMVHNE